MDLFRGMCHPDPQYLAVNVKEAKCTCLGYETRLIRLHTLDRQLGLAFLRSSHSATADPKEENNQGTPDKPQVPQVVPPVIGLHN
jgi:hypothetical protein